MTKVYIEPNFGTGVDPGDGGIRKVVEAMRRHLPAFGYEVVDSIEAADIVHTHAGHTPNVPVGVPWVTSCHGLYWNHLEWPKWAEKLNSQVIDAMRRADAVTAPSEWVAQALRRGMLLNPTVLYHGVDADEWTGGESEGFILQNKTRVDPITDPTPFNELVKLAPDLRFVSTFADPAPNVHITGRLAYLESREVIKAAGVYISTAMETFGIGTLEALAAGVPVVGWNWGGQREIIQHGVTGWLAPVGSIEGLLEGVRWAIQNRAEVGALAQEDVRARWTWERAIVRYAALYGSLLAGAEAQKQAPRVSVVVPCYNLAAYLPDTLRSLQTQTAQDWEAIIVDDASPDDGATASVAAQFAANDPRFRYHRNASNLYLAGVLNTGAGLARGRYLINLDADNMLAAGALEVMADALDADRGIAISYGAVQFVTEDGHTPDKSVGPGGRSAWPPNFEYRHQITGFNDIPSSAMMRLSVVTRTGGWRRRWRTAEDADFWTRATSYGAVPRKVTDAVTLVYRQREGSMSRVEVKPDWPAWYPWSRSQALTPFGVAAEPPARMGLSWPVPSAEPVRVAVIIPVGPGHEHLLIDALDSVDAQTFRQWECVVVNDTGAALPYTPSWAKVLTTQKRGSGPAAARNMGIAATQAPLLLFLDADDYLQPDALEALTTVQRERGGVVYSSWYDDFGDGTPAAKTKVYEPPEYDAALLLKRGCIHAVTALYPRTAVEGVGGFDESLSHWEDWDLQLKLAAAGVCGTLIKRPLWTYRKAAGQRREANAAAFNAGKAAILAKWGRFWEHKEELMACRSCPGGGGNSAKYAPLPSYGGSGSGSAQAQMQAQQAAADQGLVLLEYLVASPGVVTYRGPVTGTAYRFGNIDTARQKYVHPQDAPGLLAFKGKFRRASEGVPAVPVSPQLEAPGAPTPRSPLDDGEHMVVRPQTPPTPVKTNTNTNTNLDPFVAGVLAGGAQRPQPQMTDREAVAAVMQVAESQTYMEIRTAVPSWDREQVAVMLAKERASEQPRENVVKLLEAALPHAKEPAALEEPALA